MNPRLRKALSVGTVVATLVVLFWNVSPASGSAAPSSFGPPATTSLTDGRQVLFAIGSDGALWHNWQTSVNGGWYGWYSLGRPSSSSLMWREPAVALNADGRLEVFAIATSGAVWHRWYTCPTGCSWSAWSNLGGNVPLGDAEVIKDKAGRLVVFVVGTDFAVWHIRQQAASCCWPSSWTSLGGVVDFPAIGVTVAVNKTNGLEVFVMGTTREVYHKYQICAGCGWYGWYSLGGDLRSIPEVAVNADGRLEVFALGPAFTFLYHKWETTSGGWSSGWAMMDSEVSFGWSPNPPRSARNADGRLAIFLVRKDAVAGRVWWKAQTCAGCGFPSTWSIVDDEGTNTRPAVGINKDGRLDLFGYFPYIGMLHAVQTCSGCGFGNYAVLP